MLAVALVSGAAGIELPDKIAATVGCADLTSVVPAQFLADMVIVVAAEPGGKPIKAVVVESQLRSNEEKMFSWPVYVTVVRRLYKCDAFLLVICPDLAEAEECRKAIHIGHPGFGLEPIVVDPACTPDPQDPDLAPVGPELTVFAACMGTLDLEAETGQRQVLDAIRGLDTEQRRAYQTLILAVVSDAARHALEALMATPAYKSEFVDSLVGQGLAQGKADTLLKILQSRDFHLTKRRHDEVETCRDVAKLDRWIERALTARTAEDVFAA
jgi:hypothetical protein